MFDNLSDRISKTLKGLRGQGRLTEADIDKTVREIRRALLDADVAVPVVRQFASRVRERALGAEVSKALNPAQQVVKIVTLSSSRSSAERPASFSSRRIRRQ